MAESFATRRLRSGLERFQRQGNPYITVQPSRDSMLLWHFVLHGLPEDTVYKDGHYHGKLSFPEQYPFAPPSVLILTPNGRLVTDTWFLLSMEDFHAETGPAWVVSTILEGVISFMIGDEDPECIALLEDSEERRLELAKSSMTFNLGDPEFCELFQDMALVSLSAFRPPVFTAPPHVDGDEERSRRGSQDSARSTTFGGRSSVQRECWICKENDEQEGLIQPCACRGSMSGVHKSCVEAWIGHHRADTNGGEMPRCPVCHQAYSGTEERPGMAVYAKHMCLALARHAVRSTALVACLVGYWVASQPEIVPLWVRIPIVLVAGVFLLYKVVVLSVSIPTDSSPPQGCCRHFHVEDMRLIAVFVAELGVAVLITGSWCLFGHIGLSYFLPMTATVVIPAVVIMAKQHGACCSSSALLFIGVMLASPVLVLHYIAREILTRPRRLADPFDALLHMFVPIATMPLIWFCASQYPVLGLWALHSVLLMGGMVEMQLVRRVHWKESRAWWILIQFSSMSAYATNMLYGLKMDSILEDDMSFLLIAVSLFWLACSCATGLMVNWNELMQQFHTWQNQNGTFTLATSSSAPRTPAASSASGTQKAEPAEQRVRTNTQETLS